MYKYKTYTEWISRQKVISFVDFLLDNEQNGSSIPISFKKFIEMDEILFSIFFVENYIWEEIVRNNEIYRDFFNKIEMEFINWEKQI